MDENAIKRIQPHSKEAEQSVIGAMLMDRDVISDIESLLVKEDFYITQYGILYENMTELYREGKPVDVITLSEKLKTKDVPEEISSPMAIAEIISKVPTSANAKHYADIVRDKSVARQLIKVAQNIEHDCFVGHDSVTGLLEYAEQNVFKLVQSRTGATDIVPIDRIVIDVIKKIEEASKQEGDITGLPTGFRDLDNMLTGLHGGELIIVAARPSMGKTAFVLNIAHNVAVMNNKPVAFFSLEMGGDELVTRLLALDALVDSKSLKKGKLSDDDWDKVIESTEIIAKAPLFIESNSGITLSELRSECRRLKHTQDIGLIIIDYLQLMNQTRTSESRQQFIADVSRNLKILAKELNVPIIALSQLSRAAEGRQDHKPMMSDLRESGAIEQDADVIMFIYRDEVYNPETTTKPNTAEIIIAKQRAGEIGSVDLRWIGKYTKFADPEKYYKNPQE